MNKYEAEKIINVYGAALARETEAGWIRRKSWLTYSKAKIKYAFFVYIEALIEESGSLDKEIGSALVTSYSIIDAFIEDSIADEMNQIHQLILDGKFRISPKYEEKKLEYRDYQRKAIGFGGLFDEINEYISECYKEFRLKTISK